MKCLARTGLLSLCVAVGLIATGCPASPGNASASVPVPAAPAESPEQVVMDVTRGLSEGRPYVAWDALPASYQDDLTELVHDYAAKVDPELWNKSFAIIRSVAGMLQNQKDNILAMPKFRDAPGFDAEQVGQQWDLVVAPVITITESELATLSTLQAIDIREFLATTGVQFMQDLVKLSAFANDADDQLAVLAQTKATLVSSDGDTAMVRIEVPGKPEVTEAFVRVEGKWIPEDIAEDWADEMDEARTKIARMSSDEVQPAKPAILSVLGGIDETVARLDQAQSPEQFEQALKMGMFQVFGGMMEIAQAMESGNEQH